MLVIKIQTAQLLSGSLPQAYADDYDGTQYSREFDYDDEE